MSLFEDKTNAPLEGESPTHPSVDAAVPVADQPGTSQGDPSLRDNVATFAAPHPAPPANSNLSLPEDLRISWSWPHLILFIFFGGVSLFLIQAGFLVYYAPFHRMTNEKDIERFVLSKPEFAVGSMILWYAFLLLFLYVTLSVLRGDPFWRSLGWRRLASDGGHKAWLPWACFVGGCALSFLVFAATAGMHTPKDVPIEELFRYKNTAILFMGMAVLVAPLVEETVFRGYLYPLLAKSFGVAPGVIVTGILFGLMHGAQLGWTWGLVSVLIVVGVIFTFVRARTGTVVASFFLHLGYNFTIAAVTVLATKGFTQMPPAP